MDAQVPQTKSATCLHRMMAEAMMIVVNMAALTTMIAKGIGALSGTWYSASPTYDSR